MSRATAEPLSVGLQRLKGADETPWEPRPRDPSVRAQVAWLLVIVKLLCVHNANWLLSAAIHAALTLCVAGFAFHAHAQKAGIGIEAGNFEGDGGEGFDSVLVDGRPEGGGGKAFETTNSEELAEMARRSTELDGLNELLKMGMGGSDDGDGGDGGGSGGGSGTGTGKGRGPGLGLGAGFFGSKGKGKSIVYVVDCSGSMYGRRFERAKTELVRSVNRLTPEQKFYIFFFNDKTFPLFDPKPAKGMLPASKANLARASTWIRKQDCNSTTDPTVALQRALELKPDVIFLLTDGDLDNGVDDISKEVRKMLVEKNVSHVTIHTIAFESDEGAATLEAISRENNGTFRFVR
jgi:hypothetical protein